MTDIFLIIAFAFLAYYGHLAARQAKLVQNLAHMQLEILKILEKIAPDKVKVEITHATTILG